MQALGPHDVNRRPAWNAGNNARGKRKREAPDDYTIVEGRQHPGPAYSNIAEAQLDMDFPMFFKADVRHEFFRKSRFYAPTYKLLYDASVRNLELPGVKRVKNKRPIRRALNPNLPADPEFLAEYEWVHGVWKAEYDARRTDRKRRRSELPGSLPRHSLVKAPAPAPQVFPAVDESMKIECGCCFDDNCSFDTMIQCPDAHLFCRDCVRAQAGTAVGSRQRDIVCMDASGCKLHFPVAELQKCLDPRTFELWQKIVQAEDIAAANLEGLEYCPNCDFAMIFEVGFDAAPLLTCLKSECRFVSCRRCKKKEHTGCPCETAEDAKLKVEHAVEEAMTKALLRECPGCKVPFVKLDGCNKMVCQNQRCRVISCYLCREIITLKQPYDHFERGTNAPQGLKCKLWDGDGQATATGERHAAEVKAAERLAREQLRATGTA